MSLNKALPFIAFKYAHWALIYLFFTKILETSIWGIFLFQYLIDKFARLVIISATVKPECCGFLLCLFVVAFQIEEVFSLRQNQEGRDFFRSETINAFLVPQIIFVMLWSFLSRDETSFLIQIPIMIVISFYLNYIWGRFLRGQHYEFYQFFLLYIEFIAYFGLIYVAIGVKYFFLFFIPFQFIIVVILCARFSKTILFQQNNPIANGLIFAYFGLIVYFHCGLDHRSSNSAQEFHYLKNLSQRTQNFFLISKMICLIVLLVPIGLNALGYISIDREGISDNLLLGILIISLISILIYLIQIILYILVPSIVGVWYLEIEGLEELRYQNELHRRKNDQQRQLAYITINPFESTLTRQQKQSKEFMYALLFNFKGLTFNIHNIGQRDKFNNDKMKVKFYQRFNNQDLQFFLCEEEILEDIIEIQFCYSFSQNLQILYDFIMLINNPTRPILVKAIDMPLLLLLFQQNNIQLSEQTFISIVFFQKHLSDLMSVNPKQVLYDLYDY